MILQHTIQMKIQSKLPNLGTTIFSVMSALANEVGAINLSQGFPNYECDARLLDLVSHYLKKGMNQYAPMPGVPALTQRLAAKIETLYGTAYNSATEITITPGATEALFSAIMAFVHPGDEVIVIEPAYDCYVPSIELAGGKAVPYALSGPEWKVDWVELGKLISPKTRMIMINTPHNPVGTILKDSDMQALQKLVDGTDIIVLSDEVYEHMVFDGQPHCSVMRYPALRARSLAVFSFGKTLHATGWKMGYIVGDERLMQEFRKVHQFNVFSVNTPIQYAIADYLEDSSVYNKLPAMMQHKRDLFLDLIEDSPFNSIPSQGTYFQLADYSDISNEADTDFAIRMTKEFGVAVIPISVFYTNPVDNKAVRFCVAKTDETLEAAAERICKISIKV
jgi:methionine aminotransferase